MGKHGTQCMFCPTMGRAGQECPGCGTVIAKRPGQRVRPVTNILRAGFDGKRGRGSRSIVSARGRGHDTWGENMAESSTEEKGDTSDAHS